MIETDDSPRVMKAIAAFQEQLSHRKLKSTDLCGSLAPESYSSLVTLHWEENQTEYPQLFKERNHIAVFGYRFVLLQNGQTLAITGPKNEQNCLYIERLEMEEQSSIHLKMDTKVIIGHLRVIGEGAATLKVKPDCAPNGVFGGNSIDGQNAETANQIAGDGGNGGDGTDGGDAEETRNAIAWIALLDGNLTCCISAGNGGNGGRGGDGGRGGNAINGKGGNGGNGGNGGKGGNAGSGGNFYVTVTQMAVNSRIIEQTPVPTGGLAGPGGQGGCFGSGKPEGFKGLNGTAGTNGSNGQPGNIHLRIINRRKTSE